MPLLRYFSTSFSWKISGYKASFAGNIDLEVKNSIFPLNFDIIWKVIKSNLLYTQSWITIFKKWLWIFRTIMSWEKLSLGHSSPNVFSTEILRPEHCSSCVKVMSPWCVKSRGCHISTLTRKLLTPCPTGSSWNTIQRRLCEEGHLYFASINDLFALFISIL